MKLFKKLFIHSLKHYIIAISIILVFVPLYIIISKSSSIKNISFDGFKSFFYYIDSLGLISLIVLFYGLLLLVHFFGAFDTFAYSFMNMRRGKTGKYDSLYDYSSQRKEKQKDKPYYFMPYIVIGLFFSIISGIILFTR